MRKTISVLAAAAAMTLVSCSSNASLPDEPYEAVPYNLYPAPADAYVGDTMPYVTDEGELELYYLAITRSGNTRQRISMNIRIMAWF